jgi:Mitochondrial domain of unknown function (DUF1713)
MMILSLQPSSLLSRAVCRVISLAMTHRSPLLWAKQSPYASVLQSVFRTTSIRTEVAEERAPSGTVPVAVSSSVWHISTFKRRRTKMNQHKLKKRRKKLRLNTKISRS